MNFDIRTRETASETLHKLLNDVFNIPEFISYLASKYGGDVDEFLNAETDFLESLDIEGVKYIGFHVTTSNDECAEIKKHGIVDLRTALSINTNLKRFLMKHGITFDFTRNIMICNNTEHDVNYENYRAIADYGNSPLKRIAHKLCYDPQVNGFFNCDNIGNYSIIDKYPEILHTISEFTSIELSDWKSYCTCYKVHFAVEFDQIAWFTFYDSKADAQGNIVNRVELKKTLIRRAFYQATDGLCEKLIFLNPEAKIHPDQILNFERL